MNIRIITLCLALVAPFVLAQESPKQAAKVVAAERVAMLETLQRGKEVKGYRERYRFLPEVHAVERRASAETPPQTFARIGENGAQLVETKGRLVLFRSAQRSAASVEGAGGSAVYPVVLNTRTGTFGVLTGTLVVKPKRMADAAAIASSHGLEKRRSIRTFRPCSIG